MSLRPGDGKSLLTDAEREAVRMAGELYALIRDEVCGHAFTRDDDLAEVRADIHHIQYRIMGQAAAREYPGEFRLLGEVIACEQEAAR